MRAAAKERFPASRRANRARMGAGRGRERKRRGSGDMAIPEAAVVGRPEHTVRATHAGPGAAAHHEVTMSPSGATQDISVDRTGVSPAITAAWARPVPHGAVLSALRRLALAAALGLA